jgi:hypothetical protein
LESCCLLPTTVFVCRLANPNLKAGDGVKLVTLSKPQSIRGASVIRKAERCRDSGFQSGYDYYSLSLAAGQVESLEIALAIVKPAGGASIKKGLVSLDLDGDGRREYFRKCTSSEGVHLTVWSGRPLESKRRWHYYYYLRYDVVPTCRRKDYAELELNFFHQLYPVAERVEE